MKFAVAILAILSVASPLSALELPASGSGALAKAIQSQLEIIPLDKVIPIFMFFAAKEKDVHAALQILQSNEFKLFVQDVEAIPEVKDLLNYTQAAGLDINTLKDKLTENLDLDHISPLEASAGAETIPELKNLLKYVQEAGVDNITLQKRLKDFLDLEHVSPVEYLEDEKCVGFSRFGIAITNLFRARKYDERLQGKFQIADVYRDFVQKCEELDLKKIYLSIRSNEHYVKVVQEAEQAGIFSAECRKYYPLLVTAKAVLALAL